MIRFPNAKINLGLRIVARRPDGYHNIETVFYPFSYKMLWRLFQRRNRRRSCLCRELS